MLENHLFLLLHFFNSAASSCPNGEVLSQLPMLPTVLLLLWGAGASAVDPEAVAPAGTFVGYLENGTKIFRGIPYAEPPVKELRWKKTVKKAKITGKLKTQSFGPSCAQLGPAWPSLGGTGGGKIPCQNPMMGCPNMTWSNLTSEECVRLLQASACTIRLTVFALRTPACAIRAFVSSVHLLAPSDL